MLYVVPTPIGNLDDITIRAVRVLGEVDVIAAEDTRHSGMLLKHLGISKPMLSFHEHNEAARTRELVGRLGRGESVALITDAGMPSVSDPGFCLVRACARAGLGLTVLPGPCALVTALAGSGFPTHAFFFGGFLPVKSGRRANAIGDALLRSETAIFYESPHRLLRSLSEIADRAPDREVCVARELSKKFEEYRRGAAADLILHYEAHPPKGEIVLLIAPPTKMAQTEDGKQRAPKSSPAGACSRTRGRLDAGDAG